MAGTISVTVNQRQRIIGWVAVGTSLLVAVLIAMGCCPGSDHQLLDTYQR